MLYQMLTGQVPFKGSNPMAIYWKHIREQPTRPSLLNPAISPAVERVMLCALEKDPGRRFKTPLALARAYREALEASSQPHPVYILAQTSTYPTKTLSEAAASITEPALEHLLSLRQRTHRRFSLVTATLLTLVFLLVVSLFLGFSLSNVNSGIRASTTTLKAGAPFDNRI